METNNLTIQDVKSKQTKKGNYYLTFQDNVSGMWWNVFNKEHHQLIKAGNEIEVDYEVENGYKNIKDIRFVVNHPLDENVFTEEKKNDSIIYQVRMKEIGECWRAGKLQDDDHRVKEYLGFLGEGPLVKEAKKLSGKEINLGSIRQVLAEKGYKTEAEQKKMLLINDWKEITDLEGAMVLARDLLPKDEMNAE